MYKDNNDSQVSGFTPLLNFMCRSSSNERSATLCAPLPFFLQTNETKGFSLHFMQTPCDFQTNNSKKGHRVRFLFAKLFGITFALNKSEVRSAKSSVRRVRRCKCEVVSPKSSVRRVCRFIFWKSGYITAHYTD